MPSGKPFPDAEAVVTAWLKAAFPDARVRATLPADLTGAWPILRPQRVGGATRETLDDPRIAVDVYGPTWDVAIGAAVDLQTAFVRAAGTPISYGSSNRRAVICNVTCPQGPVRLPYTNPDVVRVGLTFSLTLQAA